MVLVADGGGGASLTVSQLQAFDGGPFTSAGSNLNSAANSALDALNSVNTSRGQLSSWSGGAAQAASSDIGGVTRPLSNAAEILQSIQGPISGFVGAVNGAKTQLASAVNGVKAMSFNGQPFTYDDQGNVTPPPPPTAPSTPADSAPDPSAAKEFAISCARYTQLCQQGENFQVQMQEALATASAADSSLTGRLSSSTSDAGDLHVAVGGGAGAGAANAALNADAAPINAADVNATMALINQAAAGNQQAANQLMSGEYSEWAKDPRFATSLLNQMGAKQLLHLPYEMSNSDSLNQTPVLQFLSRTLATGTTGVSEGVPDGGTEYTVGSDYLDALTAAGRAADTKSEPGYWALGQILANTSTPYSTGFVVNVGQNMIDWDQKSNKHGDDVVGPNSGGYDQSDPLVGLMTALSVNGPGGSGAPGAQALFDPNNSGQITSDGNYGNLYYLIHDHNWTSNPDSEYFSDNGAALGQAIKSAGLYGSAANPSGLSNLKPGSDPAIDVTSTATAAYGRYLYDNHDQAPSLSGLREPMAQLLSAHYGLVSGTVYGADNASTNDNLPTAPSLYTPKLPSGAPASLAAGGENLSYVIAQIAQDPKAGALLLGAAQDFAVTNNTIPGQFANTSGHNAPGAETLGFVQEAMGDGLDIQGKHQDAAQLAAEQQESSLITHIEGTVIPAASSIASAAAPETAPLVAPIAGVSSTVLGQITQIAFGGTPTPSTKNEDGQDAAAAGQAFQDGHWENYNVGDENGIAQGQNTADTALKALEN